jgi:hypothetical protein
MSVDPEAAFKVCRNCPSVAYNPALNPTAFMVSEDGVSRGFFSRLNVPAFVPPPGDVLDHVPVATSLPPFWILPMQVNVDTGV